MEESAMNWAHAHLLINHIPVFGMVCAVLLLIYAVIRRRDDARTLSFALFVLIALMTIAVFVTGMAVDRTAAGISGAPGAFIVRHEEMGQFSLVLMVLLGIAALFGLVIRRRTGSIPKCTLAIVMLMSIITSVVMGITANLGGRIRHESVRVAVSSVTVP
jgi:uncharacterized membrane protein